MKSFADIKKNVIQYNKLLKFFKNKRIVTHSHNSKYFAIISQK